MTPTEKQAVKEVLMQVMLGNRSFSALCAAKDELGMTHLDFTLAGWVRSDRGQCHITPKGIALVEQGE